MEDGQADVPVCPGPAQAGTGLSVPPPAWAEACAFPHLQYSGVDGKGWHDGPAGAMADHFNNTKSHRVENSYAGTERYLSDSRKQFTANLFSWNN